MTYLLERLIKFAKLPYDWDGHKACEIDPRAIDNTIQLLRALNVAMPGAVEQLISDDLTPSTYGTVGITWEWNTCDTDNYVELDIGRTHWSYYTVFSGKPEYHEPEAFDAETAVATIFLALERFMTTKPVDYTGFTN